MEVEDSDDEIFEDAGHIELKQKDSGNSDVDSESENERFKEVLSTDSEEDRYFASIAQTHDVNTCCIRIPDPPSPEVDDSYWDGTPAGRAELNLGREVDEWPIERSGYWLSKFDDDEKQPEEPDDLDWSARLD